MKQEMKAEKAATTRTQKFKEGLQIFLIVFGAGFGFYKFIYEDIWVPSRRPPSVTLAATLDELDRADGMILVRAHLVVANHGDVKVWVPALWWNVFGVKFNGKDRTSEQFANDVRPLLEGGDKSLSRFSSVTRDEVVAAGREPSYELWYQPKDESVHEHLFLVPEEQFDALQLYVHAVIIKNIDKFAPTRWAVDDQGQLTPVLLVKKRDWDRHNPNRVDQFNPETNRAHFVLTDTDVAGQNFTTASVRIRPKASATIHN